MDNADRQSKSEIQADKLSLLSERLRFERERRGWSQAEVAELVTADSKSVGRWERGEVYPSPYYRHKLLEVFGKSAEEIGLIEENTHDTSKKYLNQISLSNSPAISHSTTIKIDQEQQMALLEYEKQLIEMERQRLELQEKRLEVQKKGIEYALEVAKKVIDTLQPNADEKTRETLAQSLLPNFLQLLLGKELEFALPEPQNREEKVKLPESD